MPGFCKVIFYPSPILAQETQRRLRRRLRFLLLCRLLAFAMSSTPSKTRLAVEGMRNIIDELGARVSEAEARASAAETRASEAEAALTAEAAKAREWKRLYDELIDAMMTQRVAERRAA